ncbi:hypothetical protein [uncultured Thiothrix sp.]|uniref:hypothetical protein n=1 Tax=uncultured Thiothrix sp. TaxID=223185 RepID=UPI002607101D|nr:hypothetical protein [uncultured Thiothrix sp.]HMT91591.1 hypothetical protein [Thiolinea sp.]
MATVHWVVKHEGVQSPDAVVRYVHNWNDHKKQFTPRQIGIALNTLQQKNWL